ncbi:leucine-rich repeat receptor-like serine/threonine-protein kinase [Corchorus olitorius]|uniref:Leucine-rich repeat receptor-like serine/threonine-protein kinase n=1 Tax=Corchorus olitorius TaxID=93759 RepID=A0A1R3K6G5_9ROSI|nr:leucine-rich repeat receptor-like serine/threonine-protein kinase [Corchorus olitorius]
MDVFAFGIILIGLIAKKVFIVEDYSIEYGVCEDATFVDEWATEEYERRKSMVGDMVSLVHESLEVDPDFQSIDGVEATKLAMQCLEPELYDRTYSDELVEQLLKLHVLQDSLKPWSLQHIMTIEECI